MAKYNQKSAATLNYEAIYLTSNANDKVFLNCSTCKTEPAWFWKWKEIFMWHLQYAKFVSVKTQLYLGNRVYVFESATYFNLGYVILRLTTILITNNEEENVEVLVWLHIVNKIQCYKSHTSITIHAIRGFLRITTGWYAILSIVDWYNDLHEDIWYCISYCPCIWLVYGYWKWNWAFSVWPRNKAAFHAMDNSCISKTKEYMSFKEFKI